MKDSLGVSTVELLQFPAVCTFGPSRERVERVQLRDFVYFDALTKDRFFLLFTY